MAAWAWSFTRFNAASIPALALPSSGSNAANADWRTYCGVLLCLRDSVPPMSDELRFAWLTNCAQIDVATSLLSVLDPEELSTIRPGLPCGSIPSEPPLNVFTKETPDQHKLLSHMSKERRNGLKWLVIQRTVLRDDLEFTKEELKQHDVLETQLKLILTSRKNNEISDGKESNRGERLFSDFVSKHSTRATHGLTRRGGNLPTPRGRKEWDHPPLQNSPCQEGRARKHALQHPPTWNPTDATTLRGRVPATTRAHHALLLPPIHGGKRQFHRRSVPNLSREHNQTSPASVANPLWVEPRGTHHSQPHCVALLYPLLSKCRLLPGRGAFRQQRPRAS